jgi:hypothetical protein
MGSNDPNEFIFIESDKSFKKRRMKFIPASVILYTFIIFILFVLINIPLSFTHIMFLAIFLITTPIILLLIKQKRNYSKLKFNKKGFINPTNKGEFIQWSDIKKVRYFPPSNYLKFYIKSKNHDDIRASYFGEEDIKEIIKKMEEIGIQLDTEYKL